MAEQIVVGVTKPRDSLPVIQGWHESVCDLIRLLNSFGGSWLEDARELGAYLAKVPADPEERGKVESLTIVKNVLADLTLTLARIGNQSRLHLSEIQQDQLLDVLRRAQLDVQRDAEANRNERKRIHHAAQRVGSKLETFPQNIEQPNGGGAGAPPSSKPRRKPNADRDEWIKSQPGSARAIRTKLEGMIMTTHSHWKIVGISRINAIKKSE